MIKELCWLALGGAAGTLSRYGLSGLVQQICGPRFPWGTLAVNALGCLMFGLVWSLAEERLVIGGQTRFIILTGYLGALTTFSTYAFETTQLIREASWLPVVGNLMAQNVLGIVCVLAGIAAGRLL